ncbi:hypothetical protein M493_14515 [Geobacillus genomosp. 3]|uniref:Uncharacterized protein n=1 Tax=Geobacillus genomosp. 3 TaxID=1921421 RepID=S6A3I7_GEOG3|nr:hypothetical protein M493_14515 [Geobacillus genomosp. 3]
MAAFGVHIFGEKRRWTEGSRTCACFFPVRDNISFCMTLFQRFLGKLSMNGL